jgi:glyoxylate reductase
VRIYVTGPVPPAIASALAEDFEVSERVEGADGILSLLTTTVDASMLDRAGPQLRIAANYAVGVNNIDLEAARARGVLIANTPDVLTGPTAELAVTLMLTLLRRVAAGDRLIRRREPWGFSLEFMLGESLDGKLVGIVGPGRIGRETARLVEAFGARTLFAGRSDPLGELLATGDVVSLHCPLTPETHHLIDAKALRR